MDKDYDMDDKQMDWLLDLTEPGHQLTDDELDRLMADEDAMRTYRLLTGAQDAVRTSGDASADADQAWQTFMQRHATESQPAARQAWLSQAWLYRVAAVAAVLLVGLCIWLWPRHESGFVAYERVQGDTLLTLSANGGNAICLTGQSGQQIPGMSNHKGQLVLDYQALVTQGQDVSGEVETHHVEMPCGEDFKLVLADGTEVWLHAGSSLTYPSRFVGNERRVLLDGEAYFRVAKDAERPFIILTDELQARVLGTELNVSSRKGEQPHVALVNGCVEVKRDGVPSVTLHPGQGATLTEGQGFVVAEENMEPYEYWLKGYLYYDETPLSDVVMSLGRWYNVNVVVENAGAMDLHMRFFCRRSDGLLRVADLLNSFRQFKAEVKDNTIYIR